MPCRTFRFGEATVIVCTRGERAPTCATPGCHNRARYLCDYPVTRKGIKGTCDRRLCASCAAPGPGQIHHCPPHRKLVSP